MLEKTNAVEKVITISHFLVPVIFQTPFMTEKQRRNFLLKQMQLKLLNTDVSIPNFKGQDKQMHTVLEKHSSISISNELAQKFITKVSLVLYNTDVL